MLRCISGVRVENTSSVRIGHGKSEIWVHLQGQDLFGIRKVWWDGSHCPSVAMEGYRQAKKVRRDSCPLVRAQFCMDDEPMESLWEKGSRDNQFG